MATPHASLASPTMFSPRPLATRGGGWNGSLRGSSRAIWPRRWSATRTLLRRLRDAEGGRALGVEDAVEGVRGAGNSRQHRVAGPDPHAALVGDGAFASRLADELSVTREEAIDHFVNVMRKLPLGHLIEPRDVAAVVVFLASEGARTVTGSDYAVDAGSIVCI
jgi:hypothetical protein